MESQEDLRRSRQQQSPSSNSASTDDNEEDKEAGSDHDGYSEPNWSPTPPLDLEMPDPFSGVSMPTVHPTPIRPDDYCHFISLFREQAFSIWPVVDTDDLLTKLNQPSPSPETLAFAASLCAATIAQLRLPEHTASRNAISSLRFTAECHRFRELYDYRETHSTASVLIPFFLHIYYANANKLRTAGLLLRESIAYTHAMDLGSPQLHEHLDKKEQTLRLRIYWLLFISERYPTPCGSDGSQCTPTLTNR